MKKIYKRLIAYFIDILLTSLIITAILYLPIFKTERTNYNKYLKEYNKEYTEYLSFTNDINKYYKDKKISEKEYSKLSDKYSNYTKYLEKYYKDKKITKKEYSKLIKEIDSNRNKYYKKTNYLINKYTKGNNIISFIVLITYFLSLNILLKGQTIGKKIMKLRIVNNKNEEEKITTINHLIRIIILYNPIYYLLITIGVFLFKTNNYYYWTYILGEIKNYLEVIILVMIIIRKDNRGLHELLSQTKVISTDITDIKPTKNDIEDIDKKNKEVTVIKKNKTHKSNKNKKIIIDEE
ncbi:MAG: RDD family protein [Bacilli bacterium]|nr:RDD family protein [Bacilli bacterium]